MEETMLLLSLFRAVGELCSPYRGYVSWRACALRLCKLLSTVKILLFLTRDFLHERSEVRDGPLEKLWGGREIFEPQEFFFVSKFLV